MDAASSPKRSQNQAEIRRRMTDAAVEILRDEGVDGLTVRSVAARAGVSPTTIYNQLGSRHALIGAVFDQLFDSLSQELEPHRGHDPGTFVVRSVDRTVERVLEHRAVARELLSQVPTSTGPFGSRAIERAVELHRRNFEDAGEERLRPGAEPAIGAQLLIDGILAAQHAWALGRLDDDGFRSQARGVADVVARGMLRD